MDDLILHQMDRFREFTFLSRYGLVGWLQVGSIGGIITRPPFLGLGIYNIPCFDIFTPPSPLPFICTPQKVELRPLYLYLTNEHPISLLLSSSKTRPWPIPVFALST